MNEINRVECEEDGELVQVATKEEIENSIMIENSSRFRLVHSSPLLDDELCKELDLSGEEDLSIDTPNSQQQLYHRPEV